MGPGVMDVKDIMQSPSTSLSVSDGGPDRIV